MKNLLLLSLMVFGLGISCSGEAQDKNGIITKDISSKEMVKIIDKEGIIILDVRTNQEIAEGKIKNAVEIDFYAEDFAEQLDKLDKNMPVYVYCRSGGRSKKAQSILAEKGFKETYNLLGGFTDWEDNKLPIEK